MSASLTKEEIASGWWNVNCCDAKFTGNATAHCTACHHTFSTPIYFDRHRRYGKCLDPVHMKDSHGRKLLQDAGRKYPCWSGIDYRETA